MLAQFLLPALAVIGSATAQSSCGKDGATMTLQSIAEASGVSGCKTIKGSVVIGRAASGLIDLSGPSEIAGDLTLEDNRNVNSFTANDLTKIGGRFVIRNVTGMSELNIPKLRSTKAIEWTTFSFVNKLGIESPGITEADEVIIADTELKSLDGINITSVKKMDINNNRFLTSFETSLRDLSDFLNINANGLSLSVKMPNLVWIANMTISSVTQFAAPSLAVVNGSARFDSNYFESFSAPNLTKTVFGDISFVGNSNLKNITVPKLTNIAGGLLIANNTELTDLKGFAKLEEVGGAIKLRGSFDDINLPSLESVRGAFDALSTEKIDESCENFDKLKSEGAIQGKKTCEGGIEDANNDTSSTTGGGSGGGSGNDDKDSGAAGLLINTMFLGAVAVAGFAAQLW